MKVEKIIDVENLVKKYGKLTAVDDLSFHVNKRDIFAFLGPNGAGKTTTIKMLTTLLKPTSGSMKVNGLNPTKDQFKVRKSFGIVFQDPSLDNELSAYENMYFHSLLYGIDKKGRKEKIEKLLDFVGLLDRKDSYVKTFSGGMKRRLEIARGLIHHPKILFLDEPTIGLDPQTRNHIWNYIKELNKKEGMTVFFTTHNMDEAERYANHVAIIDYGKILFRGTPDKIKKHAKAKTIEDAFLNLTGHTIRKEAGGAIDRVRAMAKSWGNR
ncbi:multidrug ABC transporter ATP-binding protein [Candidatus Pacearchaeota archaeon CG1_02_32_132]|nr:MAG: multidrug ABC transporter ATP-binding protein [Candidatus Pacearchaeota archaeon CG1_02_32_132]